MLRYRLARPEIVLSLSLMALTAAGLTDAHAQNNNQAKPQDEPKLGWSNSTGLTLVVTGGNSNVVTFGFSDELSYAWRRTRGGSSRSCGTSSRTPSNSRRGAGASTLRRPG